MKYYRFYDTDLYGEKSYDIIDEEYKNLLEICFKYSSTLALKFTSQDVLFYEQLRKYKVNSFKYKTSNGKEEVVYYKLCPELFDLILKISNSIFKWINGCGYFNPEDPIFFRDDGSIFFSSSIHDGRITLMPRNNEDISSIIKNPMWITEKEDIGDNIINHYGINYKEEYGEYNIHDINAIKELADCYINDMISSKKISSRVLFDIRLDKVNEIREFEYHCKTFSSYYLIVNVTFQKSVCKIICFPT